jgi:SAM-dependent methyltransferase
MTAADPVALDDLLLEARAAAFGPRQFVGQESFVTRAEVLALGRAAGVTSASALLDLCCGTAGPGVCLALGTGCSYVGVDALPSSVALARRRAAAVGIPARFEVGRVPPLPPGRFDVVLLLETLLAFPERDALLAGVAGSLAPGGRFALTVEAGAPLTGLEAFAMPDSDTVWLTPLDDLVRELAAVGLHVVWEEEWTASHAAVADALVVAYEALASRACDASVRTAVERLVTSHRLWSGWLHDGRVRKHALVAERTALSGPPPIGRSRGRRPGAARARMGGWQPRAPRRWSASTSSPPTPRSPS